MESLATRPAQRGVGRGGRGRGSADAAETPAAMRGAGERPEELAHDARNMVAALELYCDLLEAPGVLAAPFRHYGSELRLVAAASRRLVEGLSVFEAPEGRDEAASRRSGADSPAKASATLPAGERVLRRAATGAPIENLAAELGDKRNLLTVLAGPANRLEMNIRGGALPVRLTREDLTRVLVNLVKNAAEARPACSSIELGLDEFHAAAGGAPWLVLTVEDDGPGIAGDDLDAVFLNGFTTHENQESAGGRGARRGLGLSIARSIVEAAGGRICAARRGQGGVRIEIELPARAG
jgi:signal transduction histidine kinase